MSITPQNLPKRTRILVKDLLFQEKYALTDTQVDIMSYIFNAFTWSMKVDGYMVLTSKKILGDLPQIGVKTLDATLRELANKGLISRSLVTVKIWRNARVRGIKISSEGMEYNSSLYTPTHQAIFNAFKEQLEQLEARNKQLETEALVLKKELEKELEKKLEKASESENSAPKNKPVEEKSETETVDSVSVEEAPQSESLDDFAKKIRNQFILTSQPLCNGVQGWHKETTFYINSYGKLSLVTPNKDFLQLNNPIEINKFWRWLFGHQERVGEIIDFNKTRKHILQKSI